MAFKDIVIPVLGEPEDGAAFAIAETLDAFAGAHKAAVLAASLPEPLVTADASMSAMLVAEAVEETRKKVAAAAEKLRTQHPGTEIRVAENWGRFAAEDVVAHVRHADLAVVALGKPGATSALRRELLEGVLMESGRAMLAIPPAWRTKATLSRIMISWDGGREAARAVAEAEPFLALAQDICVVTVDARPGRRGVGALPGADIAAHLARRGYDVDIKHVDGLGGDVGTAILTAAIDMDADLLIMGGYGHARLQQALFGGVTRTLIENSPIPILMAH